jgi:hypothetical protein
MGIRTTENGLYNTKLITYKLYNMDTPKFDTAKEAARFIEQVLRTNMDVLKTIPIVYISAIPADKGDEDEMEALGVISGPGNKIEAMLLHAMGRYPDIAAILGSVVIRFSDAIEEQVNKSS